MGKLIKNLFVNKNGRKVKIELFDTPEFTDIFHVKVDGKDTQLLLNEQDAINYVRRYSS